MSLYTEREKYGTWWGLPCWQMDRYNGFLIITLTRPPTAKIASVAALPFTQKPSSFHCTVLNLHWLLKARQTHSLSPETYQLCVAMSFSDMFAGVWFTAEARMYCRGQAEGESALRWKECWLEGQETWVLLLYYDWQWEPRTVLSNRAATSPAQLVSTWNVASPIWDLL